MSADDKRTERGVYRDIMAQVGPLSIAEAPPKSARKAVDRSPTHPELRLEIKESLQSPALLDVYMPTQPPEAEGRVQLATPVFGLSERPEPWVLRDRAALVRLDGAMAGEVYSLTGESALVGRDSICAVQIEDRGVSRTHAELVKQNGVWWLKDSGSCNGTYVDGRVTDGCKLVDGSVVRFGPVSSFRFQLLDEQHEATLKRLFETSHRDALTGGHNRRYFEDRLSMELSFAIRHDTLLSVVLMDVDRFKQVNDTYGHIAGDAVLRHVAETVRKQLRCEDLFARYGGEEFVVLLRDVESLGASVVAERVRSTVAAAPVLVDEHVIAVTLSAGCATLDECKRPTARELLSLADKRLYAAKHGGRNRVVASSDDPT